MLNDICNLSYFSVPDNEKFSNRLMKFENSWKPFTKTFDTYFSGCTWSLVFVFKDITNFGSNLFLCFTSAF